MKKNDFIIITIFLILAGVSCIVMNYSKNNNIAQVQIVIDGEVKESFDLTEDLIYKIIINEEDYNILSIKDGSVSITEASCPDHLCIKQKEISNSGESIICLPNKLVIRLISEGETSIDAVAD